MTDKIVLGNKARCMITGFTGTVVTYIERWNSVSQLGLQPRSKDEDSLADIIAFDEFTLEKLEDFLAEKVVSPPSCEIELGMKVKDVITGVEGIAIEKQTHMNGCIFFKVHSKVKLFPGDALVATLEHQRLVPKGTPKAVKSKEREETKVRGGPPVRIARERVAR